MDTDTLDGDINLADGAENQKPEPSIRDTVREAYDRAVEGAGEQTDNEPRTARKDGRDAGGRFTPKTKDADAQRQTLDAQRAAQGGPQTPHPSQSPTQQAQTPQPGEQQPQTGFQPPVGWSPQAKAQFANLPPEVQQAVAQREEQINNGFRVLQNYKGLEEFAPYVQQAGVSYHEVFNRAVQWERATLTDPVGTVTHLLKLRGLTPQLYFQALQDPKVANAIRINLQQQQGQPARTQQVGGAQFVRGEPGLTIDQARALAREEFERASTEKQIDTDVSAFLSDPAHPHAEAVVDDMVMLINAGRAETLKDAYQMALRMHPELDQSINRPGQEQFQQRQQAASRARAAAKAVTGAPVGGEAPTPKPSNANQSLRDVIRSAYNDARGRLDE